MALFNKFSGQSIVCQPLFKSKKNNARGFSLKATDRSFTKGSKKKGYKTGCLPDFQTN